jgi:hypothetical protein
VNTSCDADQGRRRRRRRREPIRHCGRRDQHNCGRRRAGRADGSSTALASGSVPIGRVNLSCDLGTCNLRDLHLRCTWF